MEYNNSIEDNLDPELEQTYKKFLKSEFEEEDIEEQTDNCKDCGEPLPQPVAEDRGNGYVELVTYCPCGMVYFDR